MREIIDILQEDGHATPERIAIMTGLDVDSVRDQIATWERERIIRRYKAVVDLDRMRKIAGVEVITALIDVSVSPERGVGFDDVAARISQFPEVRSVYLVSGVQDLRCVVTGRSKHDVADFVAQKLAGRPVDAGDFFRLERSGLLPAHVPFHWPVHAMAPPAHLGTQPARGRPDCPQMRASSSI